MLTAVPFRSDSFFIISQFLSFVKYFLKLFSKNFFRLTFRNYDRLSSFSRTAFLLYHLSFGLSSSFFAFFKTFFQKLSARPVRQLYHYIMIFSFCQLKDFDYFYMIFVQFAVTLKNQRNFYDALIFCIYSFFNLYNDIFHSIHGKTL